MEQVSILKYRFCILTSILLFVGRVNANCIPTDSTFTHSICTGDTFYVGHFAHTQAGNYSDTLTNVGGCDSVVSLALIVNPLPVVTFSWDSMEASAYFFQTNFYTLGSIAIMCNFQPAPIRLQGGNPYGGNYSGFAVSNNKFDTYLAYNYKANTVDTIIYSYIDSSGCSNRAIDTLFIFLCMGEQEIHSDNSITLHPNPTTDQFYIKTKNTQPETLSIYDVKGRMIYTMPFKPEVDVSQLSNGVYFVEVKSSDFVARKRFVKM